MKFHTMLELCFGFYLPIIKLKKKAIYDAKGVCSFVQDGKEMPMKRCKSESKTNVSQSKPCLQIEHFFAKTSH